MRKKLIILFSLSVLFLQEIRGQDHIYSQFYNAPNYLNPALNGQFEGDLRFNFIYRSQWTNIPGPLNYYTFSADLNIPRFNGGIGLMFTKSTEGTAYLNKINVSGIYSYSVDLGDYADDGMLSFGLQAGVTNRSVDASKLVFIDQLNSQGIIPGGNTAADLPQFNNKLYFDSGAGVNLVWRIVMFGVSGQHLNRPNETLTGVTSQLPIRFNSYASVRIPLDNNDNLPEVPCVIPSVVFYRQANISSFSLGMQYKNRGMNVGLWYRGDGQQHDAFVISLIFDLFSRDENGKTRFGVSHDASTSRLPYFKTAGTTEGALSYETGIPGRDGFQAPSSTTTSGLRCYHFY